MLDFSNLVKLKQQVTFMKIKPLRAKNFAGKSDFPVPEPFRPQIRTQAAAAVAQDLSLDDINEEIKAVRDGK